MAMSWRKKNFEFLPFSWSAAISAHLTADPKSTSARHFFQIFLPGIIVFNVEISTFQQKEVKLNHRIEMSGALIPDACKISTISVEEIASSISCCTASPPFLPSPPPVPC